MKFVAGIDGGGTKTRVCCRDLQGQTIAEKTFGAFNLNSIGAERFADLLTEITTYLQGIGTCAALCIGTAGISNETMSAMINKALDQAGIMRRKLVGDHVIALHGALDGAPGIALIAGTGSICFGISPTGEEIRAGGWGHLIGDEGSGYALGRDALSAVAHAWDGYGEPTLLTRLLAEAYGLDSRSKIISYVYAGDKSHVAAFSRLVEQAAASGDAVALAIIQANGAKLAQQAETVYRRLHMEEAPLAMLGGMLENKTQLHSAFVRAMACRCPSVHCIDPKHDACTGAVMMAQAML